LIATFYVVAGRTWELLRCGIEREKNSHQKFILTIRNRWPRSFGKRNGKRAELSYLFRDAHATEARSHRETHARFRQGERLLTDLAGVIKEIFDQAYRCAAVNPPAGLRAHTRDMCRTTLGASESNEFNEVTSLQEQTIAPAACLR